MHRANGARPLAHGCGHPLHRTVADVADGKDAGHARLEGERCASKCRPRFAEVPARELDIGADEAMLVERDPSQPRGRRLGADEAEEAAARLLALAVRAGK